MSEPERIVINDVEYAPVSEKEEYGPLTLVVLDRGFIYVGKLARDEGGRAYSLTGASNVRKWDKGGFGGLTCGAESSEAMLDECYDVTWPPGTEISTHALPLGWKDA